MRNLTKALNKLAVTMQLYMPQKPKNSEIRLTEPQGFTEDELKALNDPDTWDEVDAAAESSEIRHRRLIGDIRDPEAYDLR